MNANEFVGFMIFSFVTLLVFVIQIKWISRESGNPIRITKKERDEIGTMGLGKRTFVSQKGNSILKHYGTATSIRKIDSYCGICLKNIVYDIHRLVAYDTFTVCYYCWKKWNFIHVCEKLMLLSLKWNLPEDIINIIRDIMLDGFWEIAHYIIQFPSSIRDMLFPHFRKLPTLNLPFSFNEDGKVVTWYFPHRKLFLDMRGATNTYSLYMYNLLTDRYDTIHFGKEMNDENLSETFQLINQFQLLFNVSQ